MSIFIVLLMMMFCVYVVFAENNDKVIKAEIELQNKVDVEDLKEVFENSQGLLKQIINVENVNGREYTGFYVLPQKNNNFKVIASDYKKQYYEGLNQIISKFKEQAIKIRDANKRKTINYLIMDMETRKTNFEKSKKLKIKKLVLYGKETQVSCFYEKNKNRKIKFKSIKKLYERRGR